LRVLVRLSVEFITGDDDCFFGLGY